MQQLGKLQQVPEHEQPCKHSCLNQLVKLPSLLACNLCSKLVEKKTLRLAISAQPIAFSQLCSCNHQGPTFVNLPNYASEIFLRNEISALNCSTSTRITDERRELVCKISNTILKFYVCVMGSSEPVHITRVPI